MEATPHNVPEVPMVGTSQNVSDVPLEITASPPSMCVANLSASWTYDTTQMALSDISLEITEVSIEITEVMYSLLYLHCHSAISISGYCRVCWCREGKSSLLYTVPSTPSVPLSPSPPLPPPSPPPQSTLLQCLLGELKPMEGTVVVKGRVSYASQDPWVFSGSLRDNILFGQPFQPAWYHCVVEACALKTVESFHPLPSPSSPPISLLPSHLPPPLPSPSSPPISLLPSHLPPPLLSPSSPLKSPSSPSHVPPPLNLCYIRTWNSSQMETRPWWGRGELPSVEVRRPGST